MKRLFLFPIRMAGLAIKGAAWLAALALAVVLLRPHRNPPEPCTECPKLQAQCQTLQQELDEALAAQETEYLLRRRLDLRLLPELGLDWLRFETISFWDEVSLRHFERCPEGTSETIWCGAFLECCLTTTEQSSSR